jgi:hypothetical protein
VFWGPWKIKFKWLSVVLSNLEIWMGICPERVKLSSKTSFRCSTSLWYWYTYSVFVYVILNTHWRFFVFYRLSMW